MKDHVDCCENCKSGPFGLIALCPLHAAAPEMLEALETAMMDLNTIADHACLQPGTATGQPTEHTQMLLNIAFGMQKNFRAAIAKAKGESK
jgi:hypothetical protein